MAPGQLTRLRGEASIPVVQSMETPLEANPTAQSSSSAEAQTTSALTSTTGNYILNYNYNLFLLLRLYFT